MYLCLLEENGLVGQDFISYIYSTQMHMFCFSSIDFVSIREKRKLKLAIVSVNLVLCYFFTFDRQFLLCLVNISGKMWGTVYRQGRSGYSKHTSLSFSFFFFSFFAKFLKYHVNATKFLLRTIIPKDRIWDKVEL